MLHTEIPGNLYYSSHFMYISYHRISLTFPDTIGYNFLDIQDILLNCPVHIEKVTFYAHFLYVEVVIN